MRKQMEGDNQRRRALARQARERGQQPSRYGATLGASKQLTSLDQGRRAGPAPAGVRKPDSTRGGPAPPQPGTPTAERPLPQPGVGTAGIPALGYQALVDDVGRRGGMNFQEAKVAAEATVLALARALDQADRERLLAAVPFNLHDVTPAGGVRRERDLPGFLAEVARISGRSPEQARYQVEATIAALADQDLELVASLHVPDELRDLLAVPEIGGGVVGTTGQVAPLTGSELGRALSGLPYWSGNERSLSRTIELPPDNLERVLDRIDQLRQDTGRGPRIGRQSASTAVLTVRTRQVDAVTAMDIELAHDIDDAIDEVGAGMASG